MSTGKSRARALIGGAIALLFLLGSPEGPSPALAQKPPIGHAKPKTKKTKPKTKSQSPHRPHGGGGHAATGHTGGGHAESTGIGAAAAAAAATGTGAEAQHNGVAGTPGAPIELSLPIQRVTLENGLRIVMNVDRTSPTITVAVLYGVGSRDDPEGQAGLAALSERLMLGETANLADGELARLIRGRGGVTSSSVDTDVTTFTTTLPSNELAVALWGEAERMRSLKVTRESVAAKQGPIGEEQRTRVPGGEASGQSLLRLRELVYQGFWPYEHAPLGTSGALAGEKLDAAVAFHRSHFGPNAAVLSLSGDFETDEAMELIHQWFDSIPRVTPPIASEATAPSGQVAGSAGQVAAPSGQVAGSSGQVAAPTAGETTPPPDQATLPTGEATLPEQTSQRTAVVQDSGAERPSILYGWATPPARHADMYALEFIALLLGDGESSRLYQLLVRDKGLAQHAAASLDGRRGPGLFSIEVGLNEGTRVGDVEKLIEGEIKSLATRPLSDAELEKARMRAQGKLVLGLAWSRDRASVLGRYELWSGDARQVNNELGRYLAVTKGDITRVAGQYLGPTRRTIVETYPPARDPAAGEAKPHSAGVALGSADSAGVVLGGAAKGSAAKGGDAHANGKNAKAQSKSKKNGSKKSSGKHATDAKKKPHASPKPGKKKP